MAQLENLVIDLPGSLISLTALSLAWWGTWLTYRHLAHRVAVRPAASFESLPHGDAGVSILKPVKGLEPGLKENLESFFKLEHPRFELIFCLAEENDPARETIERLMSRYPRVRSTLLVGDVKVGANPKVNNIIRGYDRARHDLILISDSNTRATPTLLQDVTAMLTPDVGMVTAIVQGRGGKGCGAWLEAAFLNTFYSRWMALAEWAGSPIVIGKLMLFRRSAAARFGGMKTLARYLAEDHMAGQAMRFLGLRVALAHVPIHQPIPVMTLRSFWSRHLRWGRIRKSQEPLLFFFEPISTLWVSGIIGAFSGRALCGIPVGAWLVTHFALWYFADLLQMIILGEKKILRASGAWFLRELIYLPLWFHISIGHTVMWRGHRLVVERGGVLKT